MDDFNNKIKLYQFSEKILIKNIKYISSNVCLENQINLSPYFCFRYLYNNITESIHNRVFYNEIIDYFKKKNEYNEKFINIYTKIFDICMNERLKNNNKIDEIKIQNVKSLFSCSVKCDDCIDKFCDY